MMHNKMVLNQNSSTIINGSFLEEKEKIEQHIVRPKTAEIMQNMVIDESIQSEDQHEKNSER